MSGRTEDPLQPVKESDICCPECDYNLTGAPGDRCPWCGWEIDVETLVRAGRDRSSAARYAFAVTAAVFGGGSFLGISALILPSRELTLSDAATVMGVIGAGAGHLWLAVLAAMSPKQWPLRHEAAGSILRLIGWLAVAAGTIGAAQALDVSPNARGVQGIVVNGVFEFLLRAVFFTLPGWTLLGLRFVGIRDRHDFSQAQRTRDRRVAEQPTVPFRVEVLGRYTPDQVTQLYTDQRRATTPAIEAAISRAWGAESAATETGAGILYDGELVRMSAVVADASSLRFTFGVTSYREFLGTNLFNAKLVGSENPTAFADPLGISASIITADGYLAMGRRSDRVAYHRGFLHLFGGMLEPGDRTAPPPNGDFDLAGSIARELREELGLDASELRDMTIVGIVRDLSIHQPELILDAPVTLNRKELGERFGAKADGEHTGIEFLHDDPDAAVSFLRTVPRMTPVAQAGVLLHGRCDWGDAWYEQACYVLYGDVPDRS